MTKADPADAPTSISVVDLARMAGRTDRWVRLMVSAGTFTRAGRGRIDLASVIAGLIQVGEDAAVDTSAKASASRVTDARTREIEQRIAIRERQLIPTDDAIAEYDILVAVCRKEIDGLPAAFTRDMTERRRLEKLCDGAKTRIADALGKAGDAARTGRTDPSGGG